MGASPNGVFINDLHEPSAHVLEDPIQTHSNTNLACGGSDLSTCPDPDQVLGGSDLGASMTMSPTDVAMVALDQADGRETLLAYLLEEVLPLGRTKAQ